MPISEPFVGAPTISTTEFSFPSNSTTRVAQTTAGIYQVFVDPFAIIAGDSFQFVAYEKINGAGATQRPMFPPWVINGVPNCLLVIPSLILKDGWDFTAIKLAGTDRVIPFSIRKVA